MRSNGGKGGRTLTLLLPGLLDGLASTQGTPVLEKSNAPELKLILARSATKQETADTADALLFELFAIQIPNTDVPVAPVTYALDSDKTGLDDSYWLRADPVYLRADRDAIVLAEYLGLHLNTDEANQFTREISAHFASDHWHLEAPVPQRWYLRLPENPGMHTHPLSEVIGKSIKNHLPYGPKEMAWHAWLTELQMLLHNSPVNQQRENRGEHPVNSLWFWGGGQCPKIPKVDWAQLWSDDPTALGLANLAGVPRTGAPVNGEAWLHEAITPGRHLVVLEEWRDIFAEHSFHQRNEMQEMNQRWFSPLLKALKSGQLESLTLYPLNGQSFYLSAARARHWWKRKYRT